MCYNGGFSTQIAWCGFVCRAPSFCGYLQASVWRAAQTSEFSMAPHKHTRSSVSAPKSALMSWTIWNVITGSLERSANLYAWNGGRGKWMQGHVLQLKITPAFVILELYMHPVVDQVPLNLACCCNWWYFCPKQILIHERMCFLKGWQPSSTAWNVF